MIKKDMPTADMTLAKALKLIADTDMSTRVFIGSANAYCFIGTPDEFDRNASALDRYWRKDHNRRKHVDGQNRIPADEEYVPFAMRKVKACYPKILTAIGEDGLVIIVDGSESGRLWLNSETMRGMYYRKQPVVYGVGDIIEIIEMCGEPQYSGVRGKIEHIDDLGQLHGTWGGCAVIPEEDIIRIVSKYRPPRPKLSEEEQKEIRRLQYRIRKERESVKEAENKQKEAEADTTPPENEDDWYLWF